MLKISEASRACKTQNLPWILTELLFAAGWTDLICRSGTNGAPAFLLYGWCFTIAVNLRNLSQGLELWLLIHRPQMRAPGAVFFIEPG